MRVTYPKFTAAALRILAILVSIMGPLAMTPTSASAACDPAFGKDVAIAPDAPLDPASLQLIPMNAVLAGETEPLIFKSLGDGPSAFLSAVAAQPAERRPVLTLAYLLDIWFADRSTKDLLRVLFSGPAGDLTPEIRTALEAIGASGQANALARGMALFGPQFPRASRERAARFAPYGDPPTAFEQNIMNLDREFGSRAELLAAMETHICASPALAAWMEGARAALSEPDRLMWLRYRLTTTFFPDGPPQRVEATLTLMPEAYRAIFLVAVAEAEVFNGGVEQYFSNHSGAQAPYAAAAFRAVGLPQRARAIEQSLALFPQPYPTETRARREAMAAFPETNEEILEALTKIWRKEPLEPALTAYARAKGVVPR
jgi:hypothetical protein